MSLFSKNQSSLTVFLTTILLSLVLVSSCSDDASFEEIVVDSEENVDSDSNDDDSGDSEDDSSDSDNDSDDDNSDSDDDSGDSEDDSSDSDDDNSDSDEDSTDGDSDDDNMDTDGESEDEDSSSCTNPEDFVFLEQDGIVLVEFENAAFTDSNWELRSDEPNFSGEGFMVWTGNQSLGNPGRGLSTFSIEINTPGTYQFIWRSAVTIGDNGTDHNDTWLRFNDADDFFGERNDNLVFPGGTGKTPTPNGSSSEGWFKVYRSGNDLGFKWQSKTSDNDAHDIFVTFNSPGVYTMEISARSTGHAIDRFVLFNEDYTVNQATSDNNSFSQIECN